MEKIDILIVGGSAAGIVAAVTAKSTYPDKDVLVVRTENKVLVPCGIPYIFGTLKASEKNIIPDAVLEKAGVKLKVGTVSSIDTEKKVCKTEDGKQIQFEKLVLATGSTPAVPGWLKGADLENVFTVPKSKEYLDEMLVKLKDAKNIVVLGGGFIGVEVADELKKAGKDVTIVEILPHILGLVFDDEFTTEVEAALDANGVKINAGSGVKQIVGDKKVTDVLLNNGEKLPADAVVLAIGYRPNTALAKEAGLPINKMGFIKVDEYMRTENQDILAAGDCAEKRDFITHKVIPAMLASIACTEARIAGMNIYALNALKSFNGTLPIFSTGIGDSYFGVAGLTENAAKKECLDVVTATFEGIDRHPGSLPTVKKQVVKLIASRKSGIVLGGEVMGGVSIGEIVNLIGLAIQNKMTADSLVTAQIGTHPLMTAPPTAYPLTKAAQMVAKKMRQSS